MAGYVRNSSTHSTGDVIEVDHLNLEFAELNTAFDLTDGHTHDGSTAGDGGKLSKLLSNAITFGTGSDTDIVVTFDANSNNGLLTWMEDQDQFKFDDDIMIIDDEKLIFGTNSDVTLEYDEDGTDTLLISGDATFADDKKLYFGTNKDAYIEYDEDGNDTWAFSPPTGGLQILDDKKLVFGDGSDVSIEYDEDGEDRLRIEGAPVVISGGEGEAGDLHLYADQGDDAGDEWKISVADGGTLTFGNDLNSAGTYVTHATITPNATVANSTVTLGGSLNITTVAAAGTDTDKFLVLDGSGNVDYRAGTDVRSDIGAGTSSITLSGSTDNTVATVTGANALYGEPNFTYDGADGALTSSTSNKPVFSLTNTNTDANGSILKFVKDAGEAGAASDISGLISFYADDADQNNQEFGRIAGRVVDATSGGEEGALDFYVAEYDGTVTKGMSITGLSSDANVDVDISTHDDGTSGLKLGGTLVTSSATELNLLDGVSGLVQGDFTKLAAVDSTYGELNLLDGSAKSTSSITIGDTDAFIVIDGTTTKQIPASDISTYVGGVSLSDANVWTGKQSVDLAAANLTPAADGSHLHVEGGVTMTDNNTSGSGTAAKYAQASIEAVTLAATNASVTTTAASTFYINNAPTAGANQTLTNAYALWVDAGKVQFDADLSVGTSVTVGTDANVGNDLNLTSSGAIIDFNSDVTLTHSSNLLTLDGGSLDLDGEQLILDADADTSITADSDDQIDIRIAGADDFQFTANTFTIPSGSTVAIAAGGAITNAGSMAPDITSTGKALVFGF